MRYELSTRRILHDQPTAEQAERIVGLWLQRRWNSAEIAEHVGVHESVVDRITHAARETVHAMYRELVP